MNAKDIQFHVERLKTELAELEWKRDHFAERRAELKRRNAPSAMIRRYDLDLKDVIDVINAKNIELWGLQEMQLNRYDG